MADLNGNEAYDLSLFETHKPETAPGYKKKKPEPKPELINEKPKTRAEQHAEAKSRRHTMLKVSLICSVLLVMFAMVFSSRATILVNAQTQANQEVTLKAAKSEGIRLQTSLDSTVSVSSIETYAKNHHMQKIAGDQVFYVNPLKGDEILNYIGKPVN
jgi:hypothetical protein